MNDENFKGIVAGLEDAIAFVRGDASRATVHPAVEKAREQIAADPKAPNRDQ
jgi:hypothetical protein